MTEMSRPTRVFVRGVSVHVIQRGNNRMAICHDDQDYMSLMAFLEWAAGRFRVSVHAYALMTNHFHFIVTPADADGLPRMMKEIGTRYVRYHNRKYDRIGTLWNGRYRGLLIQDEQYWLTCLRYVEQNPVRAGIVDRPEDYRWCSYSAHAFGHWANWLTTHPVYEQLGRSIGERQAAYVHVCGQPIPDD